MKIVRKRKAIQKNGRVTIDRVDWQTIDGRGTNKDLLQKKRDLRRPLVKETKFKKTENGGKDCSWKKKE